MQSSPLLLAAILPALVVQSQPAEACTCAPVRPAISPRDGAVEVPTDAVVFVATDLGLPAVELRTLDGARVPLTIEPHLRQTDNGAFVKATPARELAPNTTYELVVEWAYGVDRSRFTTGLHCDPPPVEFTGLRGMSPEVMQYPVLRPDGNPCFDPCVEHSDHVSRIRLDFDRPRDAALVVLTLTRDDGTLVDEFALPERDTDDYVLGFQTCEVRSPRLSADTGYCGRITAYDMRGTPIGGDVEVCTSTETCAPALSGFACIPSDRCDPMPQMPAIDPQPESAPESAPPQITDGGCSSSSVAGWLLAILVPALLPRRRVKR
jgi:hypothetical protein